MLDYTHTHTHTCILQWMYLLFGMCGDVYGFFAGSKRVFLYNSENDISLLLFL